MKIFGIVFFSILLISCESTIETFINKNCKENTLQKKDDVYTCKLKENRIIDGIAYKKDEFFSFNNELKVIYGTLLNSQQIQNIPVKSGSVISYYDNGKIEYAQLSSKIKINSILFPENTRINLFKSGKIKSAIIKDSDFWTSERIEKALALKKSKDYTYTHELTINGIKYASSFDARRSNIVDISFYETGEIESGILYQNTKIDGVVYKENYPIHFYNSGKVKSGKLFDKIIKDKIAFSTEGDFYPSTNIWFYESGQIEKGWIDKVYEINNIQFSPCGDEPLLNYNIAFFENGNIKEGFLKRDTVINKELFKSGYHITFDENGNVVDKYASNCADQQ